MKSAGFHGKDLGMYISVLVLMKQHLVAMKSAEFHEIRRIRLVKFGRFHP